MSTLSHIENNEVGENTSFSSIAAKLLQKENCNKISGLKVISVTVTDRDTFSVVNLRLLSKIPGYVQVLAENGTPTGKYKSGLSNVIYISNYGIADILKKDENLAFISILAVEQPASLIHLLLGATIDIIQEFVPAGTEYMNPFHIHDNQTPIVFKNDIIINHIVKITLGTIGNKLINRYLDKLVDDLLIDL